MKTIALMIGLTIFTILQSYSQDDPTIIGYKLNGNANTIHVWQDQNGHPDLSSFNFWENNYWFKVDKTETIDKVEYVRITIPSNLNYDSLTGKYLDPPHYSDPLNWKAHGWPDGVPIDSDDFNSWLWITKADFDKYKANYYGKITFQMVFSGLSIPFKYRPATGSHSGSILNGDINLGTFLGVRLGLLGNTGGISIGGTFGVSSLPMNSSNNSMVPAQSSQSISGFTYGGGIVFDWQKKFQIGIIKGYDHAVGDLSKTYIYQDKSWFALSLNYKFLDFGSQKAAAKQNISSDDKRKSK
ncbi:hypothetical protein [Mucilaginibacter flavidus]|uniref:hypothetical protein n=1 Tax=Mucilaginibacter flavidus TaxID=2949309 RepID=UPI00209279D4|nr:hypothetical protein [Mucilaginibacter flavidus]MCO5950024.1 hypothetical protein [Mucilaginibacter flavidus]